MTGHVSVPYKLLVISQPIYDGPCQCSKYFVSHFPAPNKWVELYFSCSHKWIAFTIESQLIKCTISFWTSSSSEICIQCHWVEGRIHLLPLSYSSQTRCFQCYLSLLSTIYHIIVIAHMHKIQKDTMSQTHWVPCPDWTNKSSSPSFCPDMVLNESSQLHETVPCYDETVPCYHEMVPCTWWNGNLFW